MTPEQDLFERLQSIGAVKPTAPSEGRAVETMLAKDDKDFGTPVTLRNIFTHHDAHPVVLDMALLKAFGVDWLGWDATTIWSEIQRVFKTQISEHNRHKIQAVKSIHISNGPWEYWQVFEKIIQALNNNIPRADIVQAPGVEQLYAGVDIIDEIRREEFKGEIKAYVAAAMQHEDVLYAPPPLDFSQVELSHPYYVCMDCGNVDSALFHDGICDTCSEKFDPENNLSMRPKSELVAKGIGKNTKLVLKYNPDPVQKKWLEVEHSPIESVELGESVEDIQIAKLLVARDYANIRRRQLAEQIVSLKAWLGASA